MPGRPAFLAGRRPGFTKILQAFNRYWCDLKGASPKWEVVPSRYRGRPVCIWEHRDIQGYPLRAGESTKSPRHAARYILRSDVFEEAYYGNLIAFKEGHLVKIDLRIVASSLVIN